MDLRTGRLYESKDAARQAGVPESDIAELSDKLENLPDVKFASGPFKNRVYKRTSEGQLVRVDNK